MKHLIKTRIPFIEKWLALPKIYHWGFFVFCVSAVNFPVVFGLWQGAQLRQAVEQETTQQSAELVHQEKLFAALQQHSTQNELSPQQTKQIVALDEQINALLEEDISLISYQWDFSSRPILQIQIEGRFHVLHDFLTVLLNQQNALSFAQLDMQKMESGSVQTHLILQLKREE